MSKLQQKKTFWIRIIICIQKFFFAILTFFKNCSRTFFLKNSNMLSYNNYIRDLFSFALEIMLVREDSPLNYRVSEIATINYSLNHLTALLFSVVKNWNFRRSSGVFCWFETQNYFPRIGLIGVL